jgi:hypothetical protein
VESLPSLLPPSRGPQQGQRVTATGTDGLSVLRTSCAPDDPGRVRLSEDGIGDDGGAEKDNRPQALDSQGVGGGCLSLSEEVLRVGDRTRTGDIQIHSLTAHLPKALPPTTSGTPPSRVAPGLRTSAESAAADAALTRMRDAWRALAGELLPLSPMLRPELQDLIRAMEEAAGA